MKTNEIFDYLERLSNLLRNEQRHEGMEYGLQPVQLEALHYLSICNRYSDTPMGVTDYLGQTKGTVSQSLKLLEKKGYISKHANKEDKRSVHLKVTDSGMKLIKSLIPTPLISNACDSLNEQEQEQIVMALRQLLQTIQHSNNMKTLGVCRTCRYHQKKNDNRYFCELTQESLTDDDIRRICREHEKLA
ncbi:MAG: MarR family transcriptional regulator [Bacteroidota bacterium]